MDQDVQSREAALRQVLLWQDSLADLYGKTPWQTFLDSKRLAQEKDLSKEPALSLSKGGIASDNVVEQPVPVG